MWICLIVEKWTEAWSGLSTIMHTHCSILSLLCWFCNRLKWWKARLVISLFTFARHLVASSIPRTTPTKVSPPTHSITSSSNYINNHKRAFVSAWQGYQTISLPLTMHTITSKLPEHFTMPISIPHVFSILVVSILGVLFSNLSTLPLQPPSTPVWCQSFTPFTSTRRKLPTVLQFQPSTRRSRP